MLKFFSSYVFHYVFHVFGWGQYMIYFVIAIGVIWLLFWLLKKFFAFLRLQYLKRGKDFDSLTLEQRLDVVLEDMPEDKVCLQDYDSPEIKDWVLLYHKYHTLVVAGRAYDLSELINYEHRTGKYKNTEKVSSNAGYVVTPDGIAVRNGKSIIRNVEQDILVLHTTNKRHPHATIEFRDNSHRWPLVAELYDKALSQKEQL